MIGKQGLGLGVALGLLVASASSGCGRLSPGEPGPDGLAGQPNAGEGLVGASGSSEVGVGGETSVQGGASSGGVGPSDGGVGGSDGGGGVSEGGVGGSNLAEGGEANIAGAPPEACGTVGRSCDGSSIRVCDANGHSTIEKTCLPPEVCADAECKPIVCVPDTEFCKAGEIRECGGDGTSSALVKTCLATEFCTVDDGVVGCSPTVCTPYEPLCVGSVATACRSDGSGAKPGGQDCSAIAKACNNGECVNPQCTPGEKLCQYDDVYLCNASGSAELFTDCAADEPCDPSLGACRVRVCEPGEVSCQYTQPVSCNALGTGWVQSGPNCADSSEVCVQGTCRTRVCYPYEDFCQGNDVYVCDGNGTSATLYETCPPNSHCTYFLEEVFCYAPG